SSSMLETCSGSRPRRLEVSDTGERLQRAKTTFFRLGADDGWSDAVPRFDRPSVHMPDGVAGAVDPEEYFRDGLLTKRTQEGPFHLLELRLAPNFVIPRHHHN